MAVNPLDLQTNFMQINTVSKKEVLSREQEVLRQEYLSEHIKKDGDKELSDIPVVKESESVKKIADEDKRNNKKNGDNKKNSNEEEDAGKDEEQDKKKQNREKGVGNHLDLLG